ncbi:uncharacterized protein LOC124537306 isoform X2 [Vanessa cardui]|uniref:uncharacterized protein LOC124537306 isoform X1 n=1 Tax=Vanessa cardui TaxID=171605 RepID=UPI001F13E24E|nr:uncharacterized protein LOC124537306 isoform X1 [Vanessa cardui]XP_046970060.1 uncharacterized protein LOC124537306 isoform X2 [Vanessa cardui]
MKSFVIVLLAFVAMAAAQGVHIVDNNPSHVHVVDNNPSHVQVVDNNPSHVQVVEEADNHNSFNRPVLAPDSGFYVPNNPNNGYEQINAEPAFVDQGTFQNRPYPYKPYHDPALRGGR